MSFVRVWKQCPSIRIMYGWSTRTVFPVLDSYVFMRSASASPISRGVRDDELAMTMEDGGIRDASKRTYFAGQLFEDVHTHARSNTMARQVSYNAHRRVSSAVARVDRLDPDEDAEDACSPYEQ